MRVQATADTLDLVDLYPRLGELYETRLNDIPNAIRAYRRIFDELDKTHDGAIAALARIYEGQGAWPELDAVYQRELETASGDSAEAEIRAKIAHLAADKLGQPEKAIETWKVVLDLRGEDPEALHALANLYEGAGDWSRLVDILEREFDIASSDEDRANILTRRARTTSEKLGRDDQALDDWNRVLDIDYPNLGALRAIAGIRRRQGDPNELVGALHQLVDRAASFLDGEELKEIFRELGKTYGRDLQQPFDAAEAWTKLLDVGPDFEAMDALEAIYRTDEKWTDVIGVKMRRAEALAEPAEQIEELRGAASLWREQVGDADGARTAYERILQIDPAHDEAFSELEKLHTAASRWEPLVELYLARLETREETGQQTELLRKIARVFEEKLEDKGQALDALVNALSMDFHDRETARYLERMAQATGRWAEVIQTVNGWLKQQTEPKEKIRLCLHLAKWYGDDLGRPEYAQPYYAQIIQLDPLNVGAMRQLASLYKKAANWQQMGATLTRALEVATNDLDRKETLNDLGELLDGQMQQTDQAIAHFQRALEVDPHFLPALGNLERIYGARGQNRELVDVLQRKVPALHDAAEILAAKLRIAQLLETSLNDASRAAQVYKEVVDADATNITGLRGLTRVYQTLEQWSDLVTVLDNQLDVVTTEREKIDVLMHLATLHEEHFLKADLSAKRLEQVLEIDPNNEEAYFKLERSYRKLRQWLDLINTYDRHISATADRKTKVDLYGAIAQVYADEVEDADRAIDAYKNIIDLDDQNVPALEALAKLYDKLDDAAQSIDFMTRVAELTQDTKQRVESFYKIGKALDEKLGDRVSAQERYEMALDLDPSHIATIAALRQIAIDAADHDKAARYYDQEQSYTTSPRQRARLLVDLGKLRDEMLGDHPSAVLAWEAAYEADPENEDAAMPLADEYIAQTEWAKAEPLLDLLVRKSGKRERGEQHALQNKLGQVCAALNKDDKALKAYTAAHQLDLTDQSTIRGLAEICFRLKDWGAALTNYQKVLTALSEDETAARADVYYKLGCIKREQGQAKQAINNFEKSLSVDPAYGPTLAGARLAVRRAQGLEAGRRLQAADPRQRVRGRRALPDAQRDRRRLERSGQGAATGHRGARRGARAAAAQPGAAPQAHRALPGDRELVEDDRHAADHRREREGRRPEVEVPLHDGAALSRQGRRPGPRGRALRRGARSQPAVPRGVRAHQQDPHAEEGLQGPRARVPQDAAPDVDGERVEPGPRVQPLAQPRPHLPRSSEGHGERHRGLQDGHALQGRRGRGAADPGRALRGDRSDRGRSGRALARPPEGSAARRSLSQPLQAVSAGARVRPRLVHVSRPSRSCARRTTKSSASSRTTVPRG